MKLEPNAINETASGLEVTVCEVSTGNWGVVISKYDIDLFAGYDMSEDKARSLADAIIDANGGLK